MAKRDLERLVKRLGGKVTRSSFAAAMGVDPPTAFKQLRAFVKEGLLKLEGSKRGAYYVLVG
jgi:hypothetical protein